MADSLDLLSRKERITPPLMRTTTTISERAVESVYEK